MTKPDGGPFGVIYADPPWHFATRSAKGDGRSASQHYAVTSLDHLKAIPVWLWCLPDCALFMWTTDTHLEHALDLIRAWGFTYKTVAFTWAKIDRAGTGWFLGMGYWTRANPEMCLLATRGRPVRGARDVRQLIRAPIREHSRKPDRVASDIERLVPAGPYLEMFARTSRPGWTAWGDEVERFA